MYDPTSDLLMTCQQEKDQDASQVEEEVPAADNSDSHFVVHTENGEISLMSKESWPVLTTPKSKLLMLQESYNASQESLGTGEVVEDGDKEQEDTEENQLKGVAQEDVIEEEEPWEVVPPRQKTPKTQHFRPVMAVRKSTRVPKIKHNTPTGTIPAPPTNSFSILNSCEDDYLEDMADIWDIWLGNNSMEIRETLSAMKFMKLTLSNI